MISYLIASCRPDAVKVSIQSIRNLPPHDHEVVIVTPFPEPNYENVRFIQDKNRDGSTSAFNTGALLSYGDWVIIGIDDHVINYDVNQFLQVTNNPQMKTFEYQVINLGSPWTDCLDRNIKGYKIDIGNVSTDVLQYRWPVITFPAVSKNTILTKFNGYIFNPNIKHHFVDHWIGLYVNQRQPNYNFNLCGNHPAWTQHWPGDNCDRSRDDTDSVIFCKLAARFIQNPNAYGYETPL